MARRPAAFVLTPAEAAALDAARLQFLAWHEGLPQFRPTLLADLRQAAAAMGAALQPVLDIAMNPTASRLLTRMQEIERHQRDKAHYSELLTMAATVASLIERACAVDVRPGNKSDPSATSWICMAADAWAAAGGKPSARGRFAQALREPQYKALPFVGESGIATALEVWRQVQKGGAFGPSNPPCTS